ncbi:hypothetical protein CSW25_00955 [Thermus scotoductus]|uniref:Transcriptional regulator n=1 Tax=Thermus scotoductus TaxID=37636 RepID=A0ABY0ALE4_THESC|nr:hypothetical protein [Thermus scotoductus]RTG98392.1 hypothetical protein CSW48_00195 [Thermus scotoductus]RTH07713.1 hypothetical protein CSW46_09340 [Thermus scotoductus]RTH11322.1 hypothetical protein CSW44_05945 [Thermus scotoductus]RTH15258.1 hypothetical protein CSW43_00060 [Thermus scotoductus]RTH18574.1 hypothetical protein CSW39_04730 [Thermus scotoductus]
MALDFLASPLAPALRLLEEGRDREAEALLQTSQEGLPEAERLALLGFVEARKGNLRAYRALALEAARRAQTPLTLYHLGLALPPKAGALALEEALHRFQGDPKAEARLAFALARALRGLGRLREALGYAALALARGFGPFALLEWAWLALLAEEDPPLPDLLRQVELLALEGGTGLYARFLMAHLRFLQGEEASGRAYLRKALGEAPLPALPYLAPAGVRLLGKEVLPFLLAARPWAKEPLTQALLALAEGLYREDEEGVAKTLPLLLEEVAEEAMRGLLFLGRPHPLLGELSRRGQELLWAASPSAHFQALGEPRLGGKPLPLRQAELLVLLLARKEGWRGEELALALYGEANGPALRMEVLRLRQRGLAVKSRPYRLAQALQADFLEVWGALRQGDLSGALARYRGPLLPQSQAPGVEALRAELEEALRRAVLAQGEVESLFLLAERLGEDLGVWEALLERLPSQDPRLPIAQARVERLRREWQT